MTYCLDCGTLLTGLRGQTSTHCTACNYAYEHDSCTTHRQYRIHVQCGQEKCGYTGHAAAYCHMKDLNEVVDLWVERHGDHKRFTCQITTPSGEYTHLTFNLPTLF